MIREWSGWGIFLGMTDFDRRHGHKGHGLAGIYFFKKGEPAPWDDGIHTAVFRTRDQAQTALRESTIKNMWKRAKVVKVKVEITIV